MTGGKGKKAFSKPATKTPAKKPTYRQPPPKPAAKPAASSKPKPATKTVATQTPSQVVEKGPRVFSCQVRDSGMFLSAKSTPFCNKVGKEFPMAEVFYSDAIENSFPTILPAERLLRSR